MRLQKYFVIILIILIPAVSLSQETFPVSVDDMVFCTAIDDRNPVDIQTSFSNSIGRIYCFTKLSSTLENTSRSHVWYYNNTRLAIVDLDVNAKSWRTWSSKRIVKEWIGLWRVDIVSSNGDVICSQEFIVSSDSE